MGSWKRRRFGQWGTITRPSSKRWWRWRPRLGCSPPMAPTATPMTRRRLPAMDDNMIWLLCFLGLMLITAVALLYVLIRDETALSKRVTALEDTTEIDVLKERVALLERERDVRTLRRVVDRATAFRDENDGRPN